MILFVPAAFLAALAAAWFVLPPDWAAPAAAGAAAAGVVALVRARRAGRVVLGLALLAAALGLARVRLAQQAPSSPLSRIVAMEADGISAVRGAIVAEPIPRDRSQQLRLRVDAVRHADGEWSTTPGVALVTVAPAPLYRGGQVLDVRGRLQAPGAGGAPRYAAYLRRQGIDVTAAFPRVAVLGEEAPGALAPFGRLRSALAEGIERYLPEPQAAFVAGILLGQRTTIPKGLTEQLNRSGTSHIVAVSGYNVSVVVGAVAAALGGVGARSRRRRLGVALAASLALWGFVVLVGPSGSVLRAAAMAQLALAGRALGRQAGAGGLLLWGTVFLGLWQPQIVDDVGWQLSFLGTAGLVWLSPLLAARLGRLPGFVRESLAATVSAQVFVLPVLAAVFGRVSLVAPLSNVLGLWLVPPIMAGGLVLALAAQLAAPAAPLCAAVTWVPADLLLRIIAWSAALHGAAVGSPPWSGGVTLLYLAALAALCVYAERRASGPAAALSRGTPAATSPGGGAAPLRPRPSRTATVWRLGVAAAVVLACAGWAGAAPLDALAAPTLTVSLPAIPEATQALIRVPDGARVLLNGGPSTGSAAALLGEQLRPWDRTVDAVVLADPREAYVLGLPRVFDRYQVGAFVDLADDYASAAYRQARDAAQRRGVPRLRAQAGTELAIGRSLVLEVHAAPPEPTALRLRWGAFSLLVVGDPPSSHAAARSDRLPESTALLLTDRASRSASAAALVPDIQPELVVVQGDPPKTPPATESSPFPATGEPEPTWYRTAEVGPLHLEVRPDGYRVLTR